MVCVLFRFGLALLLVGCSCRGGLGVGARCSASSDCAAGLACVATATGSFCSDGTGLSDGGASEAGAHDAALDATALDGAALDTGTDAPAFDTATDAPRTDTQTDADEDAAHPAPRGLVTGCIGPTAACVIGTDHDVYCWGSAANGVLGAAASCTDTTVLSPQHVAGVSGADSLACGDGFACAHLTDGRMFCWGRNDLGQLGRGASSACEPTPGLVVDELDAPLVLPSADLVAAGAHACVLDLTHGAILCWGRDDGAVDVRAGAPRSRVYLHASDAMQPLRDAPTLTGGAFVTQLALSATGASARTTSRDLYLWGDNEEIQTTSMLGPHTSAILDPAAGRGAFAVAGRVHRCALDGVGAVCWGSNVLGQLGHAPSASAMTCASGTCEPAGAGLGTFTSIATSGDGDASCGVVTGGAAVRCWGDNAHGLAGVPAATTPLAALDGATPAIDFPGAMRLPLSRVFVGPHAACVIDGGTVAWCWGDADLDAATADLIEPVQLVLGAP
jgi:hypothetical protein